jgi:hypothetical protein
MTEPTPPTPAPAAPALNAPPPDVQRLLARYGSALPLYYDVHRLRALQAARERWALLRTSPLAD